MDNPELGSGERPEPTIIDEFPVGDRNHINPREPNYKLLCTYRATFLKDNPNGTFKTHTIGHDRLQTSLNLDHNVDDIPLGMDKASVPNTFNDGTDNARFPWHHDDATTATTAAAATATATMYSVGMPSPVLSAPDESFPNVYGSDHYSGASNISTPWDSMYGGNSILSYTSSPATNNIAAFYPGEVSLAQVQQPYFAIPYEGSPQIYAGSISPYQNSGVGFRSDASFSASPITPVVEPRRYNGLHNHQLARPFQPSRALLNERREPDEEVVEFLHSHNVSINLNYQGEIKLSNMMVPQSQNCGLFLTGIPPETTTAQLFQQINEGGIYNFSPTGVVPGRFRTCAAQLAFKTREAAEKFHLRGNGPLGVRVEGRRIAVNWNRNKFPPVHESKMHQTRNLQIWGPADKLVSADIKAMFRVYLKYELVAQKEWLQHDGNIRVIELSFASILGQSRQARKCFLANVKAGNVDSSLHISFSPDMCDPASRGYNPYTVSR